MSQLGRSAGLTGFLDLCGQLGVDAYAIAETVGLPREVLTSPDLRVSVESMHRMIEMAAAQSGEHDFALRMAENRRISNMGAVGLAIREQPTVRKALQAYTRYQWLQNDAFSLKVHIYAEQAVLQITGPAWQRRQSADLTAATTLRNLKGILGETWRPQEVWLPHAAPARLDTYRRVLGVTPLFEQEYVAVVITRSDLEMPIASADPEMARQIETYLERLTAGRTPALADKVSDLVVALLPDGACSVERVAQHLGMDRRTLHRRLAAEATTFSAILDDARRQMATSLLLASDRPLQNVADLLGFSSLSAFAHWFRRHFGQPAGAYRAARQARGPAGSGPGTPAQAAV